MCHRNSNPKVQISINTYADTPAEAFGRSFIQSLCDEDARLIPEKLSTTENYKDPFLGIDDFLANWWAMPVTLKTEGEPERHHFWGPSWKRRSSLASRGMVHHGFINQKNMKIPSRFWCESRWARDVDFTHLFETWVGLSQPEMAMLHVFTDPELDFLYEQEEGMSFVVGAFGGPARPGLANIGWAMAYGGSYAAEVDVARIEGAGFPVKEVGGAIVVQVTEKLSDVVDDFTHFSKRRAELKSYFRPGLFWVQDELTLT